MNDKITVTLDVNMAYQICFLTENENKDIKRKNEQCYEIIKNNENNAYMKRILDDLIDSNNKLCEINNEIHKLIYNELGKRFESRGEAHD